MTLDTGLGTATRPSPGRRSVPPTDRPAPQRRRPVRSTATPWSRSTPTSSSTWSGGSGVSIPGVFDHEDAMQAGASACCGRSTPTGPTPPRRSSRTRSSGSGARSSTPSARSTRSAAPAARPAGRSPGRSATSRRARPHARARPRSPPGSGVTVDRYRERLAAASVVTVSLDEPDRRDDDEDEPRRSPTPPTDHDARRPGRRGGPPRRPGRRLAREIAPPRRAPAAGPRALLPGRADVPRDRRGPGRHRVPRLPDPHRGRSSRCAAGWSTRTCLARFPRRRVAPMIRGFYTALSGIVAAQHPPGRAWPTTSPTSTRPGFKEIRDDPARLRVRCVASLARTASSSARSATGDTADRPDDRPAPGPARGDGIPTDLGDRGRRAVRGRDRAGIAYTRAGDFVIDVNGHAHDPARRAGPRRDGQADPRPGRRPTFSVGRRRDRRRDRASGSRSSRSPPPGLTPAGQQPVSPSRRGPWRSGDRHDPPGARSSAATSTWRPSMTELIAAPAIVLSCRRGRCRSRTRRSATRTTSDASDDPALLPAQGAPRARPTPALYSRRGDA